MSKHKKKRNKAYTGVDAAVTKPIVTRISAANRSKTGQWWFEHEKLVKQVAKVFGIIVFAIIIIVEIIRILTGNPL